MLTRARSIHSQIDDRTRQRGMEELRGRWLVNGALPSSRIGCIETRKPAAETDLDASVLPFNKPTRSRADSRPAESRRDADATVPPVHQFGVRRAIGRFADRRARGNKAALNGRDEALEPLCRLFARATSETGPH